MAEINIKNIKSFFEGNLKYYLDKLDRIPEYTKEQVLYRLSICKDDCVPKGACVFCGCPPRKKAYTSHSCNGGERFPDLMNEEQWIKYKQDNNIII